jgi:hypothetical protein
MKFKRKILKLLVVLRRLLFGKPAKGDFWLKL